MTNCQVSCRQCAPQRDDSSVCGLRGPDSAGCGARSLQHAFHRIPTAARGWGVLVSTSYKEQTGQAP